MGPALQTLDASAPTEWEEPGCLLCGGQGFMPVIATAKCGVVRCLDCGLCYTTPRPSLRSIAQFYPDDYKPHKKTNGRLSTWRRYRDNLTSNYRKVLPVEGAGQLLDFGCGGGSYLQRMKEQGWQVTGLDASEDAVSRVRTELGLPALHGTLPHPELGERSFDVITMWQSLEHVHWPLDVLTAARDLLVPGGKLIVAVPNIDSLPFRWFGEGWHCLDLPRHLVHFTPTSLSMMLRRAGFEPGPVRMIRHASSLRKSVGGTLCQRLLQRRLVSSAAAWFCYFKGMSDSMMVTAQLTQDPLPIP